MLRVVLVDDEPVVRQGLRRLIDWNAYGFEICGEACDGTEGLGKLLTLKPEVALIDIKIPNMDGIEMVHQARLQGFDGNVLVLTGCSEFQFAQHAIRVGVDGFLLKPVDEESLIDELLHIREKRLIAGCGSGEGCAGVQQTREKLLSDLVCGIMPGFRKDEALALCSGKSQACSFRVAIVNGLLADGHNIERIRKQIDDMQDAEVTFIDCLTVLLLRNPDTLRWAEILKQLLATLPRGSKQAFSTVGRAVSTLDGIAVSYKDAKALIEKQYYFDETKTVIYWDEVEFDQLTEHDLSDVDFSAFTRRIFSLIEACNEPDIACAVRDLEATCKHISIPCERVNAIFVSVYLKIKEMLGTKYKAAADAMRSECEIIAEIYKINCLHGMASFVIEELVKVAKQISTSNGEHIIERVCRYIEKNYSSPLRLSALAELFGYNSAYLGQLFWAQTGVNFNTYLDRVRIAKAKELLLHSGKKVYEISEQVGYRNINYFYRKFKAHVGMSPKDYIENGPPGARPSSREYPEQQSAP